MDARQREEVNLKNILLSCVSCVVLTGCYTQLSMFYPEPEIEEDVEEQFYETYSRAVPRPNLTLYARDGAGTSLGMAYQMMYSRFYRYYGNQYSYWNPYYYGGYYNDFITVGNGSYSVWIPVITEEKARTWLSLIHI